MEDSDEQAIVRRIRNSPPRTTENESTQMDADRLGSSKFAYWTCVVLGISSLLPWNLFITAHGYFSYKFRSRNESNKSIIVESNSSINSLEESFEVYFTVTGSAASVFAAVFNVALTSWISSNRRMIGGHISVIFSLAMSLVFCFVDTDSWQYDFLWLNLVLIIFGQIGCTFIAGSTFSMAAQFPDPSFTNGVMSAQAFCGIFTASINIVSIAVGSGERPRIVGAVYFGIALVFMIFSLAMFHALSKNPYVQRYADCRRSRLRSVTEDVEPLIDDRADEVERQVSESGHWSGRLDRNGPTIEVVNSGREMLVLIRNTLYHGTVMMLTLGATMMCFPSLTSLVKSTADKASAWQTFFIPVACFLVFNTMDFVGRLIGHWLSWPKPRHPLLGLTALCRFGFVFLFIYCNIPPYGVARPFRDDVYFVVFIALFGLTNGYLANLAAIYLPMSVVEEERERAGASTAFYSTIGVLAGSLLGMIVVEYGVDRSVE